MSSIQNCEAVLITTVLDISIFINSNLREEINRVCD